MARPADKTTLAFHGAAREVTGSCHYLRTPSTRLLVDCGLIQGGRDADERNRADFAFAPWDLDAVVLTHAHLDHCGRLPRLVRAGYTGPIHCTPSTAELLAIMLKDAAHIHLKDLEWTNRWRQRAGKSKLDPDFTLADVEQVLSQCRGLPYGEKRSIAPDVTLELLDAGHILGSSIVELQVGTGARRRLVAFSGDLGNDDCVLMRTPHPVARADVLVMEGTYGDRDHRSYADTVTELEEVLAAAHADGGNVLIPAFAVGRTQEVLYHIAMLHARGKLKQRQVFLDSPMAIEVGALYQRYAEELDSGDLKALAQRAPRRRSLVRLSRTPEESMAINRIHGGAIIIAGSGMCEGGRIRHHFKWNLWRRETHVVFVGFQAAGTLGRQIVDGARRVKLFGQEVAVKAKVHTLGGFSAHAGQRQLIDWARRCGGAPRVCLVHGEAETLQVFKRALKRSAGIDARVPAPGEVLEI